MLVYILSKENLDIWSTRCSHVHLKMWWRINRALLVYLLVCMSVFVGIYLDMLYIWVSFVVYICRSFWACIRVSFVIYIGLFWHIYLDVLHVSSICDVHYIYVCRFFLACIRVSFVVYTNRSFLACIRRFITRELNIWCTLYIYIGLFWHVYGSLLTYMYMSLLACIPRFITRELESDVHYTYK